MEKRSHGNPNLCTFFFFFLSLLLLLSNMAAAQTIPVKVGVVLDMDEFGEMAVTCLSMALSEFYSTHSHYKTRLLLTTRDSKGDVVGAAAAALDLLKNVEVAAIIGPAFSTQANFLISLGDAAQVPIISFDATSPSLNSIRSPYFVRTTLSDSSQVGAIAAIVNAFGWREVVLVYEDDEFGEGIVPYLTDALENVNVRIPYRSVFPPLATDDQIKAELYKLMTMQTRVFIVHMMSPLASRIFTKAREIGLMSPEFAWIVTNGVTNELNSLSPTVLESMLGVVGVRHHVQRSKELHSFEIRFKEEVSGNGSKVADLDIFGLWGYDSALALAMAAEKAGLKNLGYRRRITPMNSTDLEEFGVSEEGPRLIRALSSITFKGLAGEFKLVDGQLQAPPLEIVNFDGDGVRSIGYWTKKYSKSGAKRTPKLRLGSIIWPGNTTSPPRGWVVPTNGRKLRVGVPIKQGFFQFLKVTWDANNSTTVEGYCIDVFDAVMAALPYGVPYEYIPFENSYNHNMAGNYDDLTYQVFLGNYDAVAGDVTIVANRSEYVDFSLPYAQSGVAMVVPMRADESKYSWLFVKPLTWKMWLMSFCSFVFIGLLIWILEYDTDCETYQGPLWHKVLSGTWFAFVTMGFAQTEKAVKHSTRLVLIMWFLLMLILTQNYTASLASMLTVQKLQPTITDMDHIKSNESVGYMQGSFVYGYLKKMNFSESRLVEYDCPEKLDELLDNRSGKAKIVAAFHETPYINLFLDKYCSKYTMIPINKADGFGIVFPIGSPLVKDVSRAILNVTEGHKIEEIEKTWLKAMNKCPDPNLLDSPKNLGPGSFWGLFAIVGVVGIMILIIDKIVLRLFKSSQIAPQPKSSQIALQPTSPECINASQPEPGRAI